MNGAEPFTKRITKVIRDPRKRELEKEIEFSTLTKDNPLESRLSTKKSLRSYESILNLMNIQSSKDESNERDISPLQTYNKLVNEKNENYDTLKNSLSL